MLAKIKVKEEIIQDSREDSVHLGDGARNKKNGYQNVALSGEIVINVLRIDGRGI